MDPIGPIHVAPTTERTAARSRFDNAVESAKAQLTRGALASVEVASPFLPGGPVLSAAVRGAIGPGEALKSTKGTSSRQPSPAPPRDPGAGTSGTAGGSGDILEATRALQQESQSMNLQYLQLQESMQSESREFTALSNVMKVKHDTAKAAINNIH
ncbi:MAG TPA: hypothetical protein VFE30_14605 [Anaeromyxobacteraceae bacterium]|jgi:hypothetical protein|nr:hypothetical protein [Anaeromyxobacteraceae bacterium]